MDVRTETRTRYSLDRKPVGPRMPSDIDYARTHRSAMCTFSPPGELNVHGALTAASELSV